jgi:hypothetical protein
MKKRLSLILFILLSGGVEAQNNNKLPANAETFIKNQFKQLFLTKAEDMFKPVDQGGLGIAKMQQLFGVDNISNFLDEIDDISNPIYNFIKVE